MYNNTRLQLYVFLSSIFFIRFSFSLPLIPRVCMCYFSRSFPFRLILYRVVYFSLIQSLALFSILSCLHGTNSSISITLQLNIHFTAQYACMQYDVECLGVCFFPPFIELSNRYFEMQMTYFDGNRRKKSAHTSHTQHSTSLTRIERMQKLKGKNRKAMIEWEMENESEK